MNKGTFFKNESEKQNKNLLNTAQTCHSCVKVGMYIVRMFYCSGIKIASYVTLLMHF